ncbi:hypothetical protein [Membranihabitans maritimus]|uniref:hypothetical protein n=1 Tax=Membranihabitans maritimus TaxID=2904244 RepID=UPI001F39A4E0|nr:hypothetical protein [Membranihabitans maritimus]
MTKKFVFFICLLATVIIACTDDPIMTGEEVSYAGDIRPLIDTKCSNQACHGPGSTVFELTTYTQVQLKASQIREQVWEFQTMPQTGSMTQEQRALFRDWVDAGAPNN